MIAKRRPTDPLHDADTATACHLGAMGFSTRMIQKETGFTPCQVSYRLSKWEIKRKDYRDGDSEVARIVLRATQKLVLASLYQTFQANAKENA